MTGEQEALDYEPQAVPGQGPTSNGSTKSAPANTGTTRAYASPYGPHSCSCGALWTGSRTAHASCCHRTFASVGLFDAHRSLVGDHGTCRDPATLTYQSGPRAGERIMSYRDGMWRAPEMTAEEKAAAFGNRGGEHR